MRRRASSFFSTSWTSGWWTTVNGSDRKSTRLNSSHLGISYAVFCLKKKMFISMILLLGAQPATAWKRVALRRKSDRSRGRTLYRKEKYELSESIRGLISGEEIILGD